MGFLWICDFDDCPNTGIIFPMRSVLIFPTFRPSLTIISIKTLTFREAIYRSANFGEGLYSLSAIWLLLFPEHEVEYMRGKMPCMYYFTFLQHNVHGMIGDSDVFYTTYKLESVYKQNGLGNYSQRRNEGIYIGY